MTYWRIASVITVVEQLKRRCSQTIFSLVVVVVGSATYPWSYSIALWFAKAHEKCIKNCIVSCFHITSTWTKGMVIDGALDKRVETVANDSTAKYLRVHLELR